MGVTLTQRHSTQAKPGHACMCPCVSSACALYYYAARPTNHPLLIPTGRLHTPPCLATMRTCRRMASDCRVLLLPSYARQCVVRLRARTYVPLVRTRQRCRVPAPTTPATASTPTITNANATSHARPRARNVTPRIKVPRPPISTFARLRHEGRARRVLAAASGTRAAVVWWIACLEGLGLHLVLGYTTAPCYCFGGKPAQVGYQDASYLILPFLPLAQLS